MNPWILAAIWAASGAVAAAFVPRLGRRRRLAALAPLLAGGCGVGAASSGRWPGPLGGGLGASDLVLGRAGLGLLVVGGAATALALLLAPRFDGGEALAAGSVGGAVVVVLGATSPVIWSAAILAAVAALSARWITAAPGRPTLASGRVAGTGAALLLAGAVLSPSLRETTTIATASTAGPASTTVLVGALLAAGTAALLGLVPLGGWVAGATTAVRGGDLAPWALLLAPAILLSAWTVVLALPPAARAIEGDALVIAGLGSAVFGGLQALGGGRSRYGRLLAADLALAAAGLGTLHPAGRLGGLLVVLTHLGCAPLLLHPPRPGVERPRRLAWLALTGLPPTPTFWGRLLVLEGLGQFNVTSLTVGLAAAAILLGGGVRALVAREAPGAVAAARPLRVLGWAMGLGVLALGFVPGRVAGQVFGLSFT